MSFIGAIFAAGSRRRREREEERIRWILEAYDKPRGSQPQIGAQDVSEQLAKLDDRVTKSQTFAVRGEYR